MYTKSQYLKREEYHNLHTTPEELAHQYNFAALHRHCQSETWSLVNRNKIK